jgi:hypothetical protein
MAAGTKRVHQRRAVRSKPALFVAFGGIGQFFSTPSMAVCPLDRLSRVVGACRASLAVAADRSITGGLVFGQPRPPAIDNGWTPASSLLAWRS